MLTKLRSLFSAPAPAGKRHSLHGPLTLESLELRAAPAAMTQGAVAEATASGSSGTSSQGSTTQTTLSSQDQTFLIKHAQGDQQEIILGSLAVQNSNNAAVQAYGNELLTDHSKDLSLLIPILQQNGLSVPALSSDNLQTIQSLGALHGTQFDQQFLAFMVQDHINDINDNLQELSQGTDSTVREEAVSSLPVLEKHLADAYRLEQQQGSGSQGGSEGGGTSQTGSSQNGSSEGRSEDGSAWFGRREGHSWNVLYWG